MYNYTASVHSAVMGTWCKTRGWIDSAGCTLMWLHRAGGGKESAEHACMVLDIRL